VESPDLNIQSEPPIRPANLVLTGCPARGRGIMWDLDFENCFPVILLHACKHVDYDPPVLERCVNDRESVLGEIRDFFGCTRKAAKQLVLKHLHGGKLNQTWYDAFQVSQANRLKQANEPLQLIADMAAEAKAVRDVFLDTFPEYRLLLDDINVRRRASYQDLKDEWSALAWGLQTLEDKLLQHLETFLVGKGYQIDSYEFDGLKPRRNGVTGSFPFDVLQDAEAHLADQDLGGGLKVPMRIEEKEMTCPYDL
jgi:hypothetical protein